MSLCVTDSPPRHHPTLTTLTTTTSRNGRRVRVLTVPDAHKALEACRTFANSMDEEGEAEDGGNGHKGGGGRPRRLALVERIERGKPLLLFVAGDRSKVGKSRCAGWGARTEQANKDGWRDACQHITHPGSITTLAPFPFLSLPPQRVPGPDGRPPRPGLRGAGPGLHQARHAVREPPGTSIPWRKEAKRLKAD